MRKRRHTIIELFAVVAIIALLASIAVPVIMKKTGKSISVLKVIKMKRTNGGKKKSLPRQNGKKRASLTGIWR